MGEQRDLALAIRIRPHDLFEQCPQELRSVASAEIHCWRQDVAAVDRPRYEIRWREIRITGKADYFSPVP